MGDEVSIMDVSPSGGFATNKVTVKETVNQLEVLHLT